jgi:hypothetical protein
VVETKKLKTAAFVTRPDDQVAATHKLFSLSSSIRCHLVKTSTANAIEVVQRYQLNHRHDGAEHNEARAEDALAMG